MLRHALPPSSSGEAVDLAVVIVNYRTGPLVVACLASLAPEIATTPDACVVIIDNASKDGSDQLIEEAIDRHGWGGWARLYRSPINGGFAYANNLAIRQLLAACDTPARFDGMLIWLLNPDTVVRPGAARAIVAFLRAHPRAGAMGTAIEDDRGDVWPYAFRFHTLAGQVENALRMRLVSRLLARYAIARRMGPDPEPVDWVSGASVVIRGAAIRTAGWLDESYFLYFEETDFFHRVARAGWECWYVPAARVQHLCGRSTGVTAPDAASRRVPAYWFRSRRRYLVKNYGRLYAVVADLIVVAGLLAWRARCVVGTRAHGVSPFFLRDFVRHSALIEPDIEANPALNVRLAPVVRSAPSGMPVAQSV